MARREHECNEDYFNRLYDEKGILELTELELLTLEVIADYKQDLEDLKEQLSDKETELMYAESDRAYYESRAYEAEDRIRELEEENEQLMEMSADADETTQEDEVDFLRLLVADLEEELAAIDAGVAA